MTDCKSPCYGCTKHGVDINCHSTCEPFLEWNDKWKKQRNNIRKVKDRELENRSYVYQAVRKIHKGSSK